MIKRNLLQKLLQLAQQFPIVAMIGPRQSGKSTLAKIAFPDKSYVSLEDLDKRAFAKEDPRGFLAAYTNGAIIDEVQHVPELFSYMQTHVDNTQQPGQFILTGSQNFLLSEKMSQSLAGRIAILTLLPLSLDELQQADLAPDNYEEVLFKGFYPRVYDRAIAPTDWYPSYIATYLERDVRMIRNIPDLSQFQLFLKMCASRVGQLVNLSSLANDCGISQNTVKAWLSVLEQSFIIFMLQPYHKNFSKRLVKMPKLYFYDTGLVCSLLQIEKQEQLTHHFAKGALFENFVISELLKARFNQGLPNNMYFWRDKNGHEIDCLIERADQLAAVEVKSSRTINNSFFADLNYWHKSITKTSRFLVYGGEDNQIRQEISVCGWKDFIALITSSGHP